MADIFSIEQRSDSVVPNGYDYRATAAHPAAVAKNEWLDCTAAVDLDEVSLPLFASMGAHDACAVRLLPVIVGGNMLVTTTDGTLINGLPTFPLSQAYEHWEFFKAGAQWGVKG